MLASVFYYSLVVFVVVAIGLALWLQFVCDCLPWATNCDSSVKMQLVFCRSWNWTSVVVAISVVLSSLCC